MSTHLPVSPEIPANRYFQLYCLVIKASVLADYVRNGYRHGTSSMADHKHKSKTAYAYENLKSTYALLGGKNSRMFNILGHEGHLQVESKISMLYSVFGQCQGFLD